MQLEYDIWDDKTAVITRIPQPEAVIVLPSFVEGCPVTEIGTDVISLGKKSIAREIVLPETLIKISERAFTDLRYLKKLSLPAGLKEIADFGIFTCPDLTELYIPASVVTFGQCAFGYMYEHARAYKLNYFTLLCEKDSQAEKYAKEQKIVYRNI